MFWWGCVIDLPMVFFTLWCWTLWKTWQTLNIFWMCPLIFASWFLAFHFTKIAKIFNEKVVECNFSKRELLSGPHHQKPGYVLSGIIIKLDLTNISEILTNGQGYMLVNKNMLPSLSYWRKIDVFLISYPQQGKRQKKNKNLHLCAFHLFNRKPLAYIFPWEVIHVIPEWTFVFILICIIWNQPVFITGVMPCFDLDSH